MQVPPVRPRHGFTLTELMIAVAVLLVVIVATGKIFGTASKVTAVGAGAADVMQDAAAIERQLRRDFERLAKGGIFAIQSQSVPNDINGALLNPSLAPNAIIRADQLVFFTNGLAGVQTHRIGEGSFHKAQSTQSRIYYGPAYQLELGRAVEGVAAHDAAPGTVVFPWTSGPVDMESTRFVHVSDGNVFGPEGGSSHPDTIDGTQPEARRWLLARQPVILVDDDGTAANSDSKTAYLAGGFEAGGIMTARSIFLEYFGLASPQIRDGRLDAAATTLNEIRDSVTTLGGVEWEVQRDRIADQMIYYPRAERFPPGPHRVDQALSNHVIASGCSSFIVEWTYADGVGNYPEDDPQYLGARIYDPDAGGLVYEQPWFGMRDLDRNVDTFKVWQGPWSIVTDSIDPDNIERNLLLAGNRRVYQAFFGYISTEPVNPFTGRPWDTANTGVAYTPWPTAIRVTMTLHDAATNLEQGREFQFVITLPRHNQ